MFHNTTDSWSRAFGIAASILLASLFLCACTCVRERENKACELVISSELPGATVYRAIEMGRLTASSVVTADGRGGLVVLDGNRCVAVFVEDGEAGPYSRIYGSKNGHVDSMGVRSLRSYIGDKLVTTVGFGCKGHIESVFPSDVEGESMNSGTSIVCDENGVLKATNRIFDGKKAGVQYDASGIPTEKQ